MLRIKLEQPRAHFFGHPSPCSYMLGMHDCLVAALGNYTYGAFNVVTVKDMY